MIGGFVSARTRIEVPVTVEIEQTQESFHAHAIPEGIDIREGDVVQVHGAPTSVGYGEIVSLVCRATVVRAPWWERRWTRMAGMLELTELYEVGFSPVQNSDQSKGGAR